MPRKPSTKSPQKSPEIPVGKYWLADEAPWGGFINIKLDDDAHDAFDSWYANNMATVTDVFTELLGEGVKIGFAYDTANQCFIVTFTGALVDGDAARYCMTTRAGTWAECLGLAVWKHTVMAKGNYRDFLPRSGTFKTWG